MGGFSIRGALIAPFLLLAGCGGGASDSSPPPVPAAAPSPVPGSGVVPPKPANANFDVLPCLQQIAVPGKTVADLVIPDQIVINLNQAPGFPNGRRLEDPVVDVLLAALFLDLTREPVTRFVALPLNPPANDRPFLSSFPFLAPPQGSPPIGPVVNAGFNFRSDPRSAYVRVDRTGMPAVAAALISPDFKNLFNDADPIDDKQLKFVPDMTATLKGLTDALSDDFAGLGLAMCAKPI